MIDSLYFHSYHVLGFGFSGLMVSWFWYLKFDEQGYINFYVLQNAKKLSTLVSVECLTSVLVGTV